MVCSTYEVNAMSTLGQRIRNRRQELNMTQGELAAKVGYKSVSTITKIESDVNDITQSKVVQFAHALDTTVAYIMGWEEEEALQQWSKDTVFRDELDKLIEQMPDNLKQALLSYAHLLVDKDNPGKG